MSSTRSKKPARKRTAPSSSSPRRTRATKAAASPPSAAKSPAKKRARTTAVATSSRALETRAREGAVAPFVETDRVDAALEFLPSRILAAPRTGPRHAVFIDVENTSSEIDLVRVLEGLGINRATTDLTAVGNWRVVGQQLGRMLAQRGAQLVHSAPAPRVPDWSDLWIAVTAGMWLGRAAPGDALDILSDDRAFDAVGDAAARLGVTFRRITYRNAPGAVERAPAAASEAAHPSGRRRRRRRRGDGPSSGASHPSRSHVSSAARTPSAPAARSVDLASADEERHSASLDQIRAVIARLAAADPVRGVSLDTLTLALKAEGFQRPPGSPRLVTRLRRIKGVEMLSNGRVRLIGEAAEDRATEVEGAYDVLPATLAAEDADVVPASSGGATPEGGAKRRSRRRGGRRRGGRRHAAGAAVPDGGVPEGSA